MRLIENIKINGYLKKDAKNYYKMIKELNEKYESAIAEGKIVKDRQKEERIEARNIGNSEYKGVKECIDELLKADKIEDVFEAFDSIISNYNVLKNRNQNEKRKEATEIIKNQFTEIKRKLLQLEAEVKNIKVGDTDIDVAADKNRKLKKVAGFKDFFREIGVIKQTEIWIDGKITSPARFRRTNTKNYEVKQVVEENKEVNKEVKQVAERKKDYAKKLNKELKKARENKEKYEVKQVVEENKEVNKEVKQVAERKKDYAKKLNKELKKARENKEKYEVKHEEERKEIVSPAQRRLRDRKRLLAEKTILKIGATGCEIKKAGKVIGKISARDIMRIYDKKDEKDKEIFDEIYNKYKKLEKHTFNYSSFIPAIAIKEAIDRKLLEEDYLDRYFSVDPKILVQFDLLDLNELNLMNKIFKRAFNSKFIGIIKENAYMHIINGTSNKNSNIVEGATKKEENIVRNNIKRNRKQDIVRENAERRIEAKASIRRKYRVSGREENGTEVSGIEVKENSAKVENSIDRSA